LFPLFGDVLWHFDCISHKSSREFRQNQKIYFDRVDQGGQIIAQRGKDKLYILIPINDDLYFDAEMLDKLKTSLLEVGREDTKKISTSKEISELLGL